MVAGNLGLNYKYKASMEEPFEVYFDDFDLNGSKDIVLAYYNFGEQFPLRGRSCSSQQVPSIGEKFETYDIFASSDLNDVYGIGQLEGALHYAATTFATTYFENKDGKFKIHQLPNSAQFSSVNDILIDDFNKDQYLDILIAGGLYNAEVETPRNDAGYGLLLAGNGQGTFTPASPKNSGFYVPKNVKSMELIESVNGKIILVGNNNDKLEAFLVND